MRSPTSSARAAPRVSASRALSRSSPWPTARAASSGRARVCAHGLAPDEYPAVVVPVTTEHYPMLRRNIVYTAITRGRRLVVLVGQRRALAIAVRGAGGERRWSKLRDRLCA